MFDGTKRRRKSPSKKRSHKYKYTRTPKSLSECVGKKKQVCKSDPNCIVTKVGCRKRKGMRGSVQKYFGPTLPNEDDIYSDDSDLESVDSGKFKKVKKCCRRSRYKSKSKSKSRPRSRGVVQKYNGPTLPIEYDSESVVDFGKKRRRKRSKSRKVKSCGCKSVCKCKSKSRRRRKSKKVLGCGCVKTCKCRSKSRRRRRSKSKRV